MKYFPKIIGILFFASSVLAQTTQPAEQFDSDYIPTRLQSVSVTVKAGTAEGSGVVKTRNNVNYVWTAAHVVDGLRKTRKVVDNKTGTERVIVEFDDASIVQNLYEDGRKVGQIEMLAQVIRYSDADHGEDIALLRIRKRDFLKASVDFYLDDSIPKVGSSLYHVGSLKGQFGSNSVTDGIISQIGRVYQNKEFDQTSVTAFPGSSGGGVYLKIDGRYVGFITLGAGETFNMVVPIRRMKQWAEKTGLLFAIDDHVPVPSESILKNMPIEDVGREFSTSGSDKPTTEEIKNKFPYLIVHEEKEK